MLFPEEMAALHWSGQDDLSGHVTEKKVTKMLRGMKHTVV